MCVPTPATLTDPRFNGLRFFDYPKVAKGIAHLTFMACDECHSSSSFFFHSSEHRGPAQKRKPRRAGSVHLRLEHFLIRPPLGQTQ
jgi:hypothetical protein